jgi:branched-chain amino acid transport system ATP-binding protein
MGIVPLSGGSILFHGDRIDGRAPHLVAARGLAWVPEDRRVFGSLSVEENIRVAAQATGRSPSGQRVREALGFFPDLQARRRSVGNNLSAYRHPGLGSRHTSSRRRGGC